MTNKLLKQTAILVNPDSQNEFFIKGCLDFENIDYLLMQAKQIMDKHPSKNIIFNFSQITRSNSAGLALLTSLLRYANQKFIRIQFLHLSDKLWAAAKISNLDKILPCA